MLVRPQVAAVAFVVVVVAVAAGDISDVVVKHTDLQTDVS